MQRIIGWGFVDISIFITQMPVFPPQLNYTTVFTEIGRKCLKKIKKSCKKKTTILVAI